MPLNHIPDAFESSDSHEELNVECVHSICRSSLEKHFETLTHGNGQCPECDEPLTLNQLTLSPYPANTLGRQQLKSTNWKCDLCAGDGIKSTARNWCHDCKKVFCVGCSWMHNKFHSTHYTRDLGAMERDEVIKMMQTDVCSLHHKEKDSYCERCNVCLCNTCYKSHPADSPGCSSQPLSVREEAMKQKSKGPTLAKEMDNLETSLKRLNKKMRSCTKELDSYCNSKCAQLWQNFEEMVENARQKTHELCEDMRQITTDQVKKWRVLLEDNENLLKELEIWRLSLHRLLSESQQDVSVVCGLRSLGSKLSSQLHKSFGSEEKCRLEVTFSNWWLKVREQLKTERIGSVSLKVELPAKNFAFDKQFNLRGSISDITSIHVSDEDNHVFICDYKNQSVIEFTEQGELVCECRLVDKTDKFTPWDMCSISRDIFVVACGLEKKIIFLKKRKIPSLEIKNIIPTNKEFLSLCKINESIFACDDFFRVDSFTKEGKKIKAILTGESRGGFWPRIRADPSTGNFWGTKLDSSEIFCFNPNGEKLRSVKTEEKITGFCVEEFGHFYFCNYDGIFSFTSKNILYKFVKKSENHCRIFALKNKIFVSSLINGKYLIKMLKEDPPKYNVRDLDERENDEVLKMMKTDICSLHLKEKYSYCEQCKAWLCDTCYLNHSIDSPGCSSLPLSAREWDLKQKSQGPALNKVHDFDIEGGRKNVKEESKRNYTPRGQEGDSSERSFLSLSVKEGGAAKRKSQQSSFAKIMEVFEGTRSVKGKSMKEQKIFFMHSINL